MNRIAKLGYTIAAGILASLTAAGVVGCKKSAAHEKYANAELYSIGSATYRAEAVQKLELDWAGGSVEIEQSTAGELQVVEESAPTENAERMHYYLDGNVLLVKYCESGYKGKIREEEKNLRILLPAGTALDIDGGNTVVTSVGTLETPKLSWESADGNFTAEQVVCDEAEVETASGKVSVGELKANKFSVETASGDISVTKLSVDSLEADSASGKLYFGLEAPLHAEVETASGNATFALKEGLGASVRFDTASGEFKTEKDYKKEEIRYVFEGAEVCNLNVKTFSGDLTVE